MGLNKDIYNIISENIKYYRKKKGLTQSELAEKCDLSHEFIRRIESKNLKKYFSLNTIYVISKALGIKLYELCQERNRKDES